MPAITDITRGAPFPAGATLVYTGQLIDSSNAPIAGSSLTSMTLTLAFTMTGDVINGVDRADILNSGRGTVDESGNVRVVLGPNDTSQENTAPTGTVDQRSMVMDWAYNAGTSVGRHQANFTTVALAGL